MQVSGILLRIKGEILNHFQFAVTADVMCMVSSGNFE
jgi:hypothetical protein